MKYFTRGFINGAMSRNRMRKAISGYDRYISSLGLSPPLDALARLNLHDGWILGCTHDGATGRLALRVRRGDLQVGYLDVTLRFSELIISEKSIHLLRKGVRRSNVEILATEPEKFERFYRYRLLLWPKGEATLAFKAVAIKSRAVSRRGRP